MQTKKEKKLFLKRFKSKDAAIMFFSIATSFLFVALITSAATTISTNVNTGGTLTVTGASTLTGAVWASSTLQATGATTLYNDLLVDTSTFYVDSTNNRVGVGSTTPAIELSVAGDGYFTGGLGLGERNAVDKTLVLSGLASDPTGASGMIYYNSGSKVVKMHDGVSWFTVGTSTSGWSLSGARLQPSDLGYWLAVGTTTQQGLSMFTLEASSTAAIPLSIVARSGQTANLLQIMNSGATNLITVNAAGNATTSNVSVAGYLWVDGYATTTSGNGNIATQGTLTVNSTSVLTGTSTITTGTLIGGGYSAGGTGAAINSLGRGEFNGDLAVNGNATTTSAGVLSTEGGATIKGTASTTSLIVGGNSTNGTLAGIVFGQCNITSSVAIAATSTIAAQCTANGVRVGDRVFVNATSSLPATLAVVSASSTAANTIGLYIANLNGGASVNTGVISLDFIGIR